MNTRMFHKDLTAIRLPNIYFGHTNKQKDASVDSCVNQLGKYVDLLGRKAKAKVNTQVFTWQALPIMNLRKSFSTSQKVKVKVKGQQEKAKVGQPIPKAQMDKS